MIEDPKFGVRRCLEGGLERCLDRLHVVWARTDHDQVKVASVIRTYSDYRVSIFLNIRTDICWCALHFRQRMSWCNSCPCCGGAVECMCQLLLGQLKAAGRPEVLKAGSSASRERSDSELGHWRNKLTGQRPPHGLALALVNRRLASSTQNFPGLHPAVLVKRPTAPTRPPPPHPTGHRHHFSPTPRSSSRPNLTDTPPFLLHPSPWHQPPTMSSALPLEIATDLFNTIDFSKKSLLSTSDPSLGGGT